MFSAGYKQKQEEEKKHKERHLPQVLVATQPGLWFLNLNLLNEGYVLEYKGSSQFPL